MALLPPRVIGPLSECSTRVRVQAQLTGATVTVFANGAPVASGVATWSDQTFLLTTPLLPGQNVTATQTLGMDTSAPSPEPVQVQAKPPTVGGGRVSQPSEPVRRVRVARRARCRAPRWSCATAPRCWAAARATTATPASTCATPLAVGMSIKAQQNACGIAGTITNGPPVDMVMEKLRTLPTPIVETPLHECERAVTISNIVHGATVTLLRSAGPNLQACFDLDSLWFGVNPPLSLGETISARQELRSTCKIKSADAAPVTVQDNTPVPVANVVPPLCSGNTTVVLSGLVMGARVEIRADGVQLGLAESPVDGTYDFLVPALVGGTTITAIQELCGEWSAPGAGVLVDPAPASLPTPKVHDPLYECGASVRVSNLHVGARVYVYSTHAGRPDRRTHRRRRPGRRRRGAAA